MEFLRTPEARFADLPDYPFAPHYTEVLGGRMHHIDAGPATADPIVCLHGEPSWCYLYRHFVPVLARENRVLCPDLFGFGKSEKPSRITDYTFRFHFEALQAWFNELALERVTLVVQDWGGLLGLSVLGAEPERFARVVIMNTFLPTGDRPMPAAFKVWKAFALHSPVFTISRVIRMGTARPMDPAVVKAYDAPFPAKRFKAGARAFPAIVPAAAEDPGVVEMQQARDVLSRWTKPSLVLWSDKDPIMRGADRWFNSHIPSRKDAPVETIRNAGHFLQEDAGPEIAERIRRFVADHPLNGKRAHSHA